MRFKGKGTSCAKSRALLKKEWDPESWDGDIWEVEHENFEPPVSLVATWQKHPFPFAGGDQPPFVRWPWKDLIWSRCLTRWFFPSSRTFPVSSLYLQNNWDWVSTHSEKSNPTHDAREIIYSLKRIPYLAVRGWIMPPLDIHILIPEINFIWKNQDLVNVVAMGLHLGRWSWSIQVGPNHQPKSTDKREDERYLIIEEKATWRWEQSGSEGTTWQGMPAATGGWGDKECILPWSLCNKLSLLTFEVSPIWFILDLWPPEPWENTFLLF